MLGGWGSSVGQTNHSEQRWILVLALGLLLSSLALSWVTRSGNCIDTAWVSAVDVQVGSTGISIPSCKTKQSAPFDPWIHENLHQISARVKSVERVLADLHLKPRALGSIKVDAEDLSKRWSLERQLVNRALWGNISDLEYNLVSDMLVENWISGTTIPTDGLSLDRQMWHSLIGLSFTDLNLAERGRFVREWIAKLKTNRYALTEKRSQWDFAQRIQKKAQVVGFDPAENRWNLPMLVMFDKDPGTHTEMRLRENRIASLRQQNLQLPFSSDHFSLSDTGAVRVGKLLLVRCQFPNIAELEFIGFEFEHVVVIQTCEDHIPDYYISALRNTKDFALKYPESQFVHLHWPSLRMVLARSGVKARTIASLFEPGSIRTFTQVGFLKTLTKDEESGLGHWDGALEPVVYYRF